MAMRVMAWACLVNRIPRFRQTSIVRTGVSRAEDGLPAPACRAEGADRSVPTCRLRRKLSTIGTAGGCGIRGASFSKREPGGPSDGNDVVGDSESNGTGGGSENKIGRASCRERG